MPVIRVDDEVYDWLKSLAEPFEDNPNSVLRRVAGFEGERMKMRSEGEESEPQRGRSERLSGKKLSQEWNVPVRHALYNRDGKWYNHLTSFPGGLFEPTGYVIFTEEEYLTSPYLRRGIELNVPGGIASIPGFKKMV